MTHKKAVDFVRAIETISETLGIEQQQLANTLHTFCDDSGKVKELIRLYNEFLGADLVTRGKMFGYEITLTEDGGLK